MWYFLKFCTCDTCSLYFSKQNSSHRNAYCIILAFHKWRQNKVSIIKVLTVYS
ncbi:uncharacterized protein DS421_2g45610 [Arachis hypogaea]|nr:uncharacterized protein DS421_2g45610 [Arachis hypogaea]